MTIRKWFQREIYPGLRSNAAKGLQALLPRLERAQDLVESLADELEEMREKDEDEEDWGEDEDDEDEDDEDLDDEDWNDPRPEEDRAQYGFRAPRSETRPLYPRPRTNPIPMLSVQNNFAPAFIQQGMSIEDFAKGPEPTAMDHAVAHLPTLHEYYRVVAISASETYPDDARTRMRDSEFISRLPKRTQRQILKTVFGANEGVLRPAMMVGKLEHTLDGKCSDPLFPKAGIDDTWYAFKNLRTVFRFPVPILLAGGSAIQANIVAVGPGRALGTLTLWIEPLETLECEALKHSMLQHEQLGSAMQARDTDADLDDPSVEANPDVDIVEET